MMDNNGKEKANVEMQRNGGYRRYGSALALLNAANGCLLPLRTFNS
jgi:hypothetical protein